MRLIKKFVITIALFCCVNAANAWWGMTGHRIVAEIATTYLTAKARAAITAILGNESLAMAANWPDFIKSDTTNNYLSPWHYINIDSGLSKIQFDQVLKSDTAADAYAKIIFLTKELQNKRLAADKKKMYLRLLIHLIGDIHQPLHVGRLSDLGGNRIKVNWFNEPTNLHSVWDDKLVDFQKLSFTEYAKAINHTTAKQRLDWQKQPLTQWLYESYEIANDLYAEITMPDQKLSYRYNYDHRDAMDLRLLKAGVRLAGLLNKIFR